MNSIVFCGVKRVCAFLRAPETKAIQQKVDTNKRAKIKYKKEGSSERSEHPKNIENQSKKVRNIMKKQSREPLLAASSLQERLGQLSGSILDPFWLHFGSKNRSKIIKTAT